ncbi:MAG TPA: hypothetical protein VFN09_07270 [Rhodanobacteraceae bacterium]|nr:hypothetical protein [Rhodanobacteraceae bacterium]
MTMTASAFRCKPRFTRLLLCTTLGLAASTLNAQVTLPHVFQPNTPARATEVNDNFNALKDAIDALQATVAAQQATIAAQQTQITALQSQLSSMGNVAAINNVVELLQVSHTDGAGNTAVYPTVRFHDVNVQVVNGSGVTDGTPNGLGNLIIGYNASDPDYEREFCSDGYYNASEPTCSGHGVWASDQRSGSHNLVLGDYNAYTRYGGIVAGDYNVINGGYASVTGGTSNLASGSRSVVSGGVENTVSIYDASICGGKHNTVTGEFGTVCGGEYGIASGHAATVSGGFANTAYGDYTSITGGVGNQAGGLHSMVCGGNGGVASGTDQVVCP